MDIREAINRKSDSLCRHPWELARIKIVKRFLRKITQNINPAEITIIDIGCGDLFVLETIGSCFNFKSLTGVDTALEPNAIKLLENKYKNTNISIYNDLGQLSANDNGTSIILLLDVIEHIKDDKTFLSDLLNYNFVNNKTFFLITVPSFQSFYCKHDEYLLHYRRYSNLQLVKLLQNSNYKIIKSGYLFFFLLLPRLLNIIKEKVFRKHPKEVIGTGLTTWNEGRLITNIIKYFLLFDFYVLSVLLKLRIKLPGLSNYVICKKSV